MNCQEEQKKLIEHELLRARRKEKLGLGDEVRR
jgi:hypothetical protein